MISSGKTMRWWKVDLLCMTLLVLFMFFISMSFGLTVAVNEKVVNSTADSGVGTMRWALQAARSGDVITFDPEVFPPTDPATIYLQSELPPITQGNLTIDASNAGVILDGSNIQAKGDLWTHGISISSDGNTVQGLQITNFSPAAGIIFSAGAKHNTVGGDRNTGSGPLGQGNLVSNVDTGIAVQGEGTSHNTITGNLVGIKPDDVNYLGGNVSNVTVGVHILEGARYNTIGPGNIIAYSDFVGILIQGIETFGNKITRNSIHSNGYQGIYLDEQGNTGLEAPIIIDFDLNDGQVEGLAEINGLVEVFSDNGREGKIFEGKAKTNGSGWFSFSAGRELKGPSLTATVTDSKGNTSAFSEPTHGSGTGRVIQDGNDAHRTPIKTLHSSELEDNYIGNLLFLSEDKKLHKHEVPGFVNKHVEIGLKWVRTAIDYATFPEVDWSIREESTKLEPHHIYTMNAFKNAGINVMCGLIHWDVDADGQDTNTPNYSRFKDEDEVQRYLEFVRDTVKQMKGTVNYYELLNEPNPPRYFYESHSDYNYLDNELRFGNQQYVRLDDYISLIEKVVPVIREEDPEAKIAIGAVCEIQPAEPFVSSGQDYLFGLLESRIMPLVDAVTFHPLYNITPQGKELEQYAVDIEDYEPPNPEYVQSYYDSYPALLKQLQETAEKNGFDGVFIADEMVFWSKYTDFPLHYPVPPYIFPEVQSAKYYLRSIILHHGNDMKALISYADNIRFSLKNLCTVMELHEAADFPVEIDINYDPIAYYTFSYPNGDQMLAVWKDGIARCEDPGTPAKITFPGLTAGNVKGIDVLHGFEQDLIFEVKDDSIVIEDLLVKDYPLLIRLEGYSDRVENVRLTADPPNRQVAGEDIIFSAEVTEGNRDAEFAFWYKLPGGDWVKVKEYSSDSTWTTHTGYIGEATVGVQARAIGSEAFDEARAMLDYEIVEVAPVEEIELTADPEGSQTSGEPITFIAEVTAGNPNAEFAFYYQLPGGSWTLGRSYSEANTWETSTTYIGEAKVGVIARALGSVAFEEARAIINYEIAARE